jgi:hypothetical protein
MEGMIRILLYCVRQLMPELKIDEAHLTRSALGFLTFGVDDDPSRGIKSSSAIFA